MKKFKKIISIGLALALVFSSMGTVFAYPLNGTNYDGIQVNDTFYSLGYITGHEAAFGDTFGPADSTKVILDFNQKAAKFSNYLAANPADFDAWASNAANQTPATPTNFMKADGTLVPIEVEDEEELTVVDVTVVNGTTIDVTFSDNSTARITGLQLTAGTHDYTFTYNGKTYTARNVAYTPPAPAQVTVQEVKSINLRHFQVLFTGKVDNESAEKPENYYFFINEGNADYMSILPESNQLDEIEGLTIEADDVDGKTVVDIYLPEDNRFTNIADFLWEFTEEPTTEELQQIPLYNYWFEFYGFDTQAWIDDEQTIIANKANDVHGVNSNFWALTAGRNVEVAVRNIRDLNGERTIDTAVKTMEIKDDTRPVWNSVHQINNVLQLADESEAASIPVVPVYADSTENVRLYFSEPVFNTHGLGVSDINNHGHYNVEVAVDDTKVASTNDQDLHEVLKFYMDAEDSYQTSSYVDLDIEAAIEKLYTDGFKADNTYKISITGITDLAGNLTNPQVLEFKVRLRDRSGSGDITIPAPEILNVMQIHDNIFRVYANRYDVTGTFEIRNGDGEDGLIEYAIDDLDATQVGDEDVWYKDVVVPAVDMETTMAINVKDDQLLAYDRQETLKRTLRVFEVGCEVDPTLTGDTYERSFTRGNEFTIKQDIYAPVVVDPDEIEWDEETGTGSTIVLDVEDIVPDTWAEDEDAAQPVYAMLYDYKTTHVANNGEFVQFDFNSIDTIATEAYNLIGYYANPNDGLGFDLLPITISYTKNGVKKTAIVSNRNLLEESANFDDESARHYGAPGSLTYDFASQKLIINLAAVDQYSNLYKDLVDAEGKLIQGVDYEIEIPSGYFADQARFNAYNFTDWDNNVVDTEKAVWFVPDHSDGVFNYTKVLYVSDGRNNNSITRADRYYNYTPLVGPGPEYESYMVHGYTSAATVVTQAVGVAPIVEEEPKDAVPQTSEELINWFEDRNEIWVEFTGSIDVDTLKNPANYVLNDMSLEDMGLTSDDIDYVVSSENPWNADDRQFAEIKLPYDTISIDGDYSFKVSGVSNEAGGTMTPVEVRLDIDENFRPIIEKAVIIGNHEIELTFNESVRYTADPDVDPENLAVAAKYNFVVYVNGAAFTPQSATVGTTPLTPNDNPDPTYPLNKIVRLNLGSVDLLDSTLDISVEIVENENGKILMEDKNCNPLNDEVEDYPFVVQ